MVPNGTCISRKAAKLIKLIKEFSCIEMPPSHTFPKTCSLTTLQLPLHLCLYLQSTPPTESQWVAPCGAVEFRSLHASLGHTSQSLASPDFSPMAAPQGPPYPSQGSPIGAAGTLVNDGAGPI